MVTQEYFISKVDENKARRKFVEADHSIIEPSEKQRSRVLTDISNERENKKAYMRKTEEPAPVLPHRN